MDEKVIANFTSNRYSKEEYLKVLGYFENDAAFESLKAYLETNWDKLDLDHIPSADYSVIKTKLQEKILEQKILAEGTLKNRIMQQFNRIAAILIIPLLIASVFLFWQWREFKGLHNSFAEITCPLGARIEFSLPDGSTGWLNSGSKLKYPVAFNSNRHIELTGEAFFKVQKDQFSPFVVKTSGHEVKVLGTEFNVMAYPEDKTFEVTLETGKVNIRDSKTNQSTDLSPSQRFVFDKNTLSSTTENVETKYYTSWKEGKLSFRNIPFSEVIIRLSRWYNVDIECNDQSLFDIPYRVTIQDEKIDRVLQLLTLTAPIKYEIIEPIIKDDETTSKLKVIITKKSS